MQRKTMLSINLKQYELCKQCCSFLVKLKVFEKHLFFAIYTSTKHNILQITKVYTAPVQSFKVQIDKDSERRSLSFQVQRGYFDFLKFFLYRSLQSYKVYFTIC